MSSIPSLNLSSAYGSSASPLLTAKPRATSSQGSSDSPSATTLDSVNSLGTTFMSLLAQELQNQDPTQPMDSTEMVGQMISLNQLDQVASINELLTNQIGSQAASASAGVHLTPTQHATQANAPAAAAANVPLSTSSL
jgi:flagellar basal-body rod modification protein FlgD